MKRFVALLSVALFLLAGCAFAEEATANKDSEEESDRPKVGLGLSVGNLSLMDSTAKGLFGSDHAKIGITALPLRKKTKWTPNFDIEYYSMSRGVNDAKLIPITVGVKRAFDEKKSLQPYVAFNVGTFYGDVYAPSVGADKSGFGLNANATAGLLIDKHWFLEARYDFFDEFDGIDFSAFTISAAYKVTNIKF